MNLLRNPNELVASPSKLSCHKDKKFFGIEQGGGAANGGKFKRFIETLQPVEA